MNGTGCGIDCTSVSQNFARPLPWIGTYIAGGSLLCAAAMAFDLGYGFRHRKHWFPTKLFSLNATTLTFLGIATKLPVDLNTCMPGRADQLTKLSGTALICTAMANSMPSLGDMTGDSDVVSNVVAVGILVVTVIVNVCIQMRTGAIFEFRPEHAAVMFSLLVQLVLLVSSALVVATTKNLLDDLYSSKNLPSSGGKNHQLQVHSDDVAAGDSTYSLQELEDHVRRHWLMAHTSDPQYVVGRSVTCTASGAFCLVSSLVLAQAVVRAMAEHRSWRMCGSSSDYSWSITLVLVSQLVAVAIGSVAPAYRWFNSVDFKKKSPAGGGRRFCGGEFAVEEYWTKRLQELKEGPLPFHLGWRRLEKPVHKMLTFSLAVLIWLQRGVVVTSKLVRLLSVLPFSWMFKGGGGGGGGSSRPGSRPAPPEMEECVLHLEGEEALVELITAAGRKDADKWMRMGEGKPPTALLELIKSYSSISDPTVVFRHAGDFIGAAGAPPPLCREEPPNCWALPLATLAAVAAAAAPADHEVEALLEGVRQGLKFVEVVDKSLDEKGLVNMRAAAEVVWSDLKLYRKWQGLDLRRPVADIGGNSNLAERIGMLEEAAKSAADKFFSETFPSLPAVQQHVLAWPEGVLAANCMYRVCAALGAGRHSDGAQVFKRLSAAIADILGACFTNLPRSLYIACASSSIESREKNIRGVAGKLGKAAAVLELLEKHKVADRVRGCHTQYLDDWCSRQIDPDSELAPPASMAVEGDDFLP